MKNISTDIGTNYKGNIWVAMGAVGSVIGTFGTEWMKLTAFVVFCGAMAMINYKIKGSGIDPEQGEIIKDLTVDDLLKDGRK